MRGGLAHIAIAAVEEVDAGVASRHRPAGVKVEGVVVAAGHPNQHYATTTSTSPQQQGHEMADRDTGVAATLPFCNHRRGGGRAQAREEAQLMQRARGGTAARLGKQGVVAAERDDGEVRGGGATADDDARRGRRWPEPTPIEDRVPGWGRAQGSTRVKSNWGERKSTSRQSSSPSRRRLGGPVMAGENRRGGRGHESVRVREDKRRRGQRVRERRVWV
jgi:hypothetical protein